MNELYTGNMQRLSLIVQVGFLVLLVSCSKNTDSIPECINEKIEANKTEVCINGMNEYRFQGELVYVFDYFNTICADFGSPVFDEDCNELCFVGGFRGNLECKGVSFYDEAELVRNIWVK